MAGATKPKQSFQDYRKEAAASAAAAVPVIDSAADLGPTCAGCLAFHADRGPSAAGECRRYAPKPAVAAAFVWPVVDGDDWCLQHRQRVAPFNLTFAPSDAAIEAGDADDD